MHTGKPMGLAVSHWFDKLTLIANTGGGGNIPSPPHHPIPSQVWGFLHVPKALRLIRAQPSWPYLCVALLSHKIGRTSGTLRIFLVKMGATYKVVQIARDNCKTGKRVHRSDLVTMYDCNQKPSLTCSLQS